MHWTAFLAYRRIPANAQIIGDVGCIHCGYNVRGLRATGNCPECGNRISDSLLVLARPSVVAQALRSFSNSYLTLTILALGCISSGFGWPMIVTAAVIFAGAVYRAWNAGELRFRGELANSAMLNSRAQWLWYSSLFEAFAASIWIGSIIAVLNIPSLQTATGSQYIVMVAMLWLYAALLNAAVAGWFGLGLATTLSYGWMMIEFKIQIWAVAACAVVGSIIVAVLFAPLNRVLALSMASVVGLMFIITFSLTWTFLHHIANAAEQAYETLDEMLEGDRLAIVPESPDRPNDEPPPISLSPPPPEAGNRPVTWHDNSAQQHD